jgi:hypothetical protein
MEMIPNLKCRNAWGRPACLLFHLNLKLRLGRPQVNTKKAPFISK